MSALRRNTLLALVLVLLGSICVQAQKREYSEDEFGPVVRAYLGYLRNEQEVVDDRVSRREISARYYRHNKNRIKALREMAIRLARSTQNDYLPELEAVTASELSLLFEHPRPPQSYEVGEVIRNTFRFLGTVRSSELFYLFARLDPYEQAELLEKDKTGSQEPQSTEGGPKSLSRSRKVNP